MRGADKGELVEKEIKSEKNKNKIQSRGREEKRAERAIHHTYSGVF